MAAKKKSKKKKENNLFALIKATTVTVVAIGLAFVIVLKLFLMKRNMKRKIFLLV